MTIDEALAWCDGTTTVDLTLATQCACTLAAEVRALRHAGEREATFRAGHKAGWADCQRGAILGEDAAWEAAKARLA